MSWVRARAWRRPDVDRLWRAPEPFCYAATGDARWTSGRGHALVVLVMTLRGAFCATRRIRSDCRATVRRDVRGCDRRHRPRVGAGGGRPRSDHGTGQARWHLVVFLKRPGGQAQFSAALSLQSGEEPFGRLHTWINANLSRDLSLSVLASQAAMSERSFSRHYLEATGLTPARAVDSGCGVAGGPSGSLRTPRSRSSVLRGNAGSERRRRCGAASCACCQRARRTIAHASVQHRRGPCGGRR